MHLSFFRRNKFFNPVRKKNHPDFIIVLNSRKRKHSTDFGNQVPLKLTCSSKITGSTDVNKQNYIQFPFFFKNLNIWMIETGCDVPVNIPDIVTGYILAYFTECHPTVRSEEHTSELQSLL